MYLTIPNFENLSAQEVFDMSVNHIANTRKPGIDDDGSCSYAAGCAASPFIHENKREHADDLGSWGTVVHRLKAPHLHEDLIIEMQRAHDSAALTKNELFMVQWKDNTIRVAKEFNLDDSKLQAVNVK